jgi:hypothetical protein
MLLIDGTAKLVDFPKVASRADGGGSRRIRGRHSSCGLGFGGVSSRTRVRGFTKKKLSEAVDDHQAAAAHETCLQRSVIGSAQQR